LLLHTQPQLTFRTFNRDYGLPNHNEDHLAPLLRDALMPARGRMHRERSLFLRWKTALFDFPGLGLPGIINFIDVRTQWFDAAVKGAIRDGIKQVGCLGWSRLGIKQSGGPQPFPPPHAAHHRLHAPHRSHRS
jgi:hypothetical protein